MTALAAQILAALDRAEETAQAAAPGPWIGDEIGVGDFRDVLTTQGLWVAEASRTRSADHILANDPAHVLRLTTALRKVVELHARGERGGGTCVECVERVHPCPTLAALASVWDEPGDNT